MQMEIDIVLYNFQKRDNSIKRPDIDGTNMTVVWESPYDIVNPIISVRGADMSLYNYAYIPQWSRYYWLNTYQRYRDDDHIIIECKCDVLATYRPQILSQSFFVELSQSNYNSLYNDSRLGVQATILQAKNSVVMPAISEDSCAQYYMEAVGLGTNGSFTNKYIILPDNLGQIAEKALNDPDLLKGAYDTYVALLAQNAAAFPDWIDAITTPFQNTVTGVLAMAVSRGITDEADQKVLLQETLSRFTDWWSDVVSTVQERFKNPWDCIVSIKGLALSSLTNFPTTRLTPVQLGVTNTEVPARALDDTLSNEITCTVAIPWQYTDFRNMSPYTQVNVILPNCDVVQLSSDILFGSQNITARYRINATSGEVAGYLERDDGCIISDFSFSIATEISIAYGTKPVPFLSRAGQVLDAVGQTVSGNGAGAANSIIDAIMPQKYNSHCSGITSMCCLLNNKLTVEVIANATQSPSSLNIIGRPCRQTLALNSVSGFTKCRDAHIVLAATKPEIDEVDSFLNGGIYIE